MRNLLEETLQQLKHNKKKESDIRWVGSPECKITWAEFKKLADTEYDEGFGAPEVAKDLVIVGDDWWLERYEYDGAECWKYKTIPKEPKKSIKLKSLTIWQSRDLGIKCSPIGWETLLNLNGKIK